MSTPKELSLDLGEIALDTLLEEGIIKEIPILSTIYTIASTATSFPDRIFAAKALRFLRALPRTSNDDRIRFLADLENNPKRKEKLTEIILLSIERTDRLEKADFIAKIFAALLTERISDSEFDSLSTAILLSDLLLLHDFLKRIDEHDLHDPPTLKIGYEQLIGAGLTRSNGTPSMDQSGTFTRASKLGLTLYRILFTNK